MPFVERDTSGAIVAVSREKSATAADELPPEDPELLAFVEALTAESDAARRLLVRSDLAMGRVLEDLIDILISRRAIAMTDFSDAAREKIVARHSARGRLLTESPLIGDSPSLEI